MSSRVILVSDDRSSLRSPGTALWPQAAHMRGTHTDGWTAQIFDYTTTVEADMHEVRELASASGADVIHPHVRSILAEIEGDAAAARGLQIETDDRVIESSSIFEGQRFGVRRSILRAPGVWRHIWNPFEPSWGEPYIQLAHRMLAAANKARDAARGHEAVCVSHQLPVYTLRRFLEGQRLWHDPRRRQCSLASLTSLIYDDDALVDIVYSEPAGASDPLATGA